MSLTHVFVAVAALAAAVAIAQDAPPAPPAFPEPVTFHPRGDDTITLEGVVRAAVQAPAKAPGVVVCHPHPLYGGTMENPVVRALDDTFAALGATTVRFNFRGVGKSGGKFDGKGGEVQDVLGALDLLLLRPEVDPKRVAIVGYSFGSWTGLQAAVQEQVRLRFFAGVGFPIAPDTVDFGPADFIRPATLPMLFVSGDQDGISSLDKIDRLLTLMAKKKHAKLVALPGVDHFFGTPESLAAMQEAIRAFAAPLLSPPGQ